MNNSLRIFIDFWNLQLAWNEYSGGQKMDWTGLPKVLVREAINILGRDEISYDGSRVYASVDATKPEDRKLRGWLENFLDRRPGFNVFIRERHPRPRKIHCKQCDREFSECPHCGQPLRRAAEKGVDAAIVTDMLSLAWENSLAVALLVSSDADYIPAVELLQNKGFKVINTTWRGQGHELARTCWGSIELDGFISELRRE